MDAIIGRIRASASAITADRRHFHAHPELRWEERETAAHCAEALVQYGFEVETGLAGTAVAARLRLGPGPTVLLRSDMDAVPVEETPGRPYGSTRPGVMHACGHDGHMAMLLGVARALHEAGPPEDVSGTLALLFQPAEEGGAGGKTVVETGVLDRWDVAEVFALHLWSGFPTGEVLCPGGPFLASSDHFRLELHGVGTHGAQPHLGRDPVVAAAGLVLALQTVVSRSVDPLAGAVLTIGELSAGCTHNVVPDSARLQGTFRAFSPEVRREVEEGLRRVAAGTCATYGVTHELDIHTGYPPTINAPRQAEALRDAASRVPGLGPVRGDARLPIAEDFAFYLERRPGALALLGCGDPSRGLDAPHHSPRFDLDERALPLGAELLWTLARERLRALGC